MNSKHRRPSLPETARSLLVDAAIVAATIDAALPALERGLAGWPTSTPGAGPVETAPLQPCRDADCTNVRPCPDHDDEPVELTATERTADQADPARHDLDRFERALRHAAVNLTIAARLSQSWAWGGMTATEVAGKLAAIDGDIWCTNCVRFGERNPKEETRTECSFCRQFRLDYKRAAPREIWAARNARGGRIDVGTIDRILARMKVEEKERKAAEKAAAKAERVNA